MSKDTNPSESSLSLDSLSFLLNTYRLPLFIAVVGLVFILSSILFMVKRNSSSGVTFVEKSASSSSPITIKVDIEGAVEAPGVYELASDSRVGDLLIMAGGFSLNADREWSAKYINQAARLSDGGKIYIPEVGEGISTASVLGASDSNSTSLVNINTASLSELDRLSGVGEVTAKKIIEGRPYLTIEELKSKKIVGNSVFEKIKDIVVVY